MSVFGLSSRAPALPAPPEWLPAGAAAAAAAAADVGTDPETDEAAPPPELAVAKELAMGAAWLLLPLLRRLADLGVGRGAAAGLPPQVPKGHRLQLEATCRVERFRYFYGS